jgi:hypothetical protein
MVKERREAEKDETLHAESERLRKAMLSLSGELSDVVADLRDLLTRIHESDDDG